MSFLETPRFPDDISYNSKGGPSFNTSIISVNSGFEHRNINWEYYRNEFDITYGIRTRLQLYELIKFFKIAKGMAYGFRYKDWTDFRSHHNNQINDNESDLDQQIGIGNGVEVDFQLIKEYTEDIFTTSKLIKKPVDGTTLISIDNVSKITGWSVDITTGVVTFSVAPLTGEIIKAGFQYDNPARFDSDTIETNLEYFLGGSITTILKEIRV